MTVPPRRACVARVDVAGTSGVIVQRVLTIPTRLDVLSRLGRALADPTRARILMSLLEAPGYPATLAGELALTRSNVSNHLACLRGCGLVLAVPEGRQVRYEIADPHLTHALNDLVNVVLAVDDGLSCDDQEGATLLRYGPAARMRMDGL